LSGYLLDTNIIGDLIRNPLGAAARHIEQVEAKDIFTSIIVAAELRYGCAKMISQTYTKSRKSTRYHHDGPIREPSRYRVWTHPRRT